MKPAARVVGTCPDLGTVEPIQHPLRWLAPLEPPASGGADHCGRRGRRPLRLARGHPRSGVAARPSEMFGPDRFHPSAAGYAAAARCCLLSHRCRLARARSAAASRHTRSPCFPWPRPQSRRWTRQVRRWRRWGCPYRPRPGQQCRIGLDAPDGPCSGAVGRSGRPATARATARSTTMGKHPRRTATSLPHELTESGRVRLNAGDDDRGA